MIELARHGSVFVLTMNSDDNRFNVESMKAIHGALDEVEAAVTPSALVVTGTGKFFSNGLDLAAVESGESDLMTMAKGSQELMARTLEFPRPTVAAINGHCFAAGAMWSLSFDHRIMRMDQGYWSLPEVDLGIPFTKGMNDLILARLTPQAATVAMTTGNRYGGDAAAAAGIVDRAVAQEAVVSDAIELAEALSAKSAEALGTIKRMMHQGVVESLRSG